MDKILKAADDIAKVFDETTEWLDPKRAAVVKILKELVGEKFTSTNSDSTSCEMCNYRDEAADMWPCEDCCHCGNDHFTQRT